MHKLEIITTSYQNNFTTPLYDSIKSKFKYSIGDVIVDGGKQKYHMTSQFDEYHLSKSQFHLELIQIFRGLSWIFKNKVIEPGGFISIYTTQSQMVPLINKKLMFFNDQLVDSPDNLIKLPKNEILNHLMIDHNIFPERLKTYKDLRIELNDLLDHLILFNNGFYVKVHKFNGSVTSKIKPTDLCLELLDTNFDQCKSSVLHESDKSVNATPDQIQYDILFRRKCGKLSNMINGIGFLNKNTNEWIKPIDVEPLSKLNRINTYLERELNTTNPYFNMESDISSSEQKALLDQIKSIQYDIISDILQPA